MKLIYIRIIGITFITITSCTPIFAQKNINKGDRYYDKNLFEDAIKYYKLDTKSKNRKVSNYAKQRLASCYRIIGEFDLAENTYRKLLKSKRNREDPIYYLNYGKSLKSSAKYAEAKIQFKEYIKLKPSDPMGLIFLNSCDSAQKWLEETIGKEVKNIEKINTPQSDFAPVLLASEQLVFSSSREGTKEALISFDGGFKVNRLDLYSANVNSLTGEEKVAYNEFSGINSPLHEGAATFSNDGKEIYFTRTIKGKKTKSEKGKRKQKKILSTLQVFYSTIDTLGNWSEPVSAFPFNSTKYSIGQPSLSKDGEKIFFISDMAGGYGETDIYYSEKREDGSWIEPINAGSEVNTFGYELFPYISENDVLYFSSDSHIGMGKLDIFSSRLKVDDWTDVQNLKPPFNSIGNDFGIVFDKQHSRGFFSSDRFNGKGAEDIYSFSEDIPPLEITLKGNELVFPDNSIFDGLKYTLKNETTKKDTTLQAVNGMYSFPLKTNNDYLLLVKKNRFSTYNQIEINTVFNSSENYLETTIKSKSNPIRFNGDLTIIDINDTNHIKRIPIVNKRLILSDTANLEFVKTNLTGKYHFKNKLQAGQEYHIVASKNQVEEEIELPLKKDKVKDVVTIVGVVEDNSGNQLSGKVIIRKEGEIIKEINTDDNGKFLVKLESDIEYEVMIISSGYYPVVKNISLENYNGKPIIEKHFKLNLTSE